MLQHQNWIALRGKITYSDGTLSLVPEPRISEAGISEIPFAEVRSNIYFESGAIRMQAILPTADAKCQLILNSGRSPEIYIGLNMGKAAYGIAVYRNGKWEHGNSAGYDNQPPLGQWIDIEIQVSGSNIVLIVDGVRVASFSETIQKSQLGMLLLGDQEVQMRNLSVSAVKPVVFVVMQFTEEYNALFSDVIRPTCESFGYQVIRGDDSINTGLIIQDITKSIQEASIIIAEITPDNPNVYYEVGFAHALLKQTILLSDRKRGRLPFDISGFRTLFYDNTIAGKSAVEARLKQHLQAIAV